jgi:sulfur carrier protein
MQIAETELIEIVVNGEPRRIPGDLTLSALLTHLEIDPERVAVEKDRRIVRRSDWPATLVDPGAQLEIVQFVGGG